VNVLKVTLYFAVARQWMNLHGVNEFIYLAARLARLARQWIKERRIIDMRLRANEPSCIVLLAVK